MAKRQCYCSVGIIVFVGFVAMQRMLGQHEPFLVPTIRTLYVQVTFFGVWACILMKIIQFLIEKSTHTCTHTERESKREQERTRELLVSRDTQQASDSIVLNWCCRVATYQFYNL
jgi:cobalamin biosynthesis protein CobD/CbiB